MIKHIVFFKVAENITDKKQATEQIINTLSPLAQQIEQIKSYELGQNFSTSDSAFDVALVSVFETQEDLNKYRQHPIHIKAVEKIKPLISKTAVVDYEI